MGEYEGVKTLDWTETLSWLIGHLDEAMELTVEGPSGILFDGPCMLRGAMDLAPSEVPASIGLEIDAPSFPDPMRLWVNVDQVHSAESRAEELTIRFLGGEAYRFQPYEPIS